MNLYKTELLTHLAAPTFEKPIDTIEDLMKSDLRKYHMKVALVFMLENHPRPELREIYKQAFDNGWLYDLTGENIQRVNNEVRNGLASTFTLRSLFKFYLTNDIKAGKEISMRDVKEVLSYEMASINLPKNGPLTKTFEKFILRAFDHGLFEKVKYKYQFREGKSNFNIIQLFV